MTVRRTSNRQQGNRRARRIIVITLLLSSVFLATFLVPALAVPIGTTASVAALTLPVGLRRTERRKPEKLR